MNLTDTQIQAVSDVANEIGVDPSWLAAIIAQESSYNPQTFLPASGSVTEDHGGLIQISDTNARTLNFASARDLVNQYPDFESQLRGPVAAYFTKIVKKQLNSFQDACMAVYGPAFIGYATLPSDEQNYVDAVSSHLSDTTTVTWPGSSGMPVPGNAGHNWLMDGLIVGGGLLLMVGLYLYLNRKKY